MTGRLAGKRCVVTGAAGGIGRAIAERFVAEGARVVGLDISAPSREAAEPAFSFVACDVGDGGDVERGFERAAGLLAGLPDIAVTSAALTGGVGDFLSVSDADWERYIRVNLTGTFLVCRAAARLMAAGRGGSLITIGSVNSFAAERGASPYAASKGGVAMLTRAMAVDLARHCIRANMIAPGPIEVPRNAELFASEEVASTFRRHVPLARAGRADDVAAAAVFLASDEAAFVTGSTVTVDGGLLARILPSEA